VIVSIDGKRVQTTGQLRNLVAAAGVNATVKVEALRSGKQQTFNVKLSSMPDEPAAPGASTPSTSSRLGVGVAPLDPATREQAKLPPDAHGLLVTSVQPGSPAVAAGIRPGDVIEQIDKQPVTSPDQLSEKWAKSQGTIALLVWRDGHTFFASRETPVTARSRPF